MTENKTLDSTAIILSILTYDKALEIYCHPFISTDLTKCGLEMLNKQSIELPKN